MKEGKNAIYRHPDFGPVFGKEDIAITDMANESKQAHTYFGEHDIYNVPRGVGESTTILAGTSYFILDDWEVFYLA